jgi:hypothetical protein
MPEIVEVEVFTLGELKALGHKGFQGAIERMRQWTYMDAEAYGRDVIECNLVNMFGRDSLMLMSWSDYPESITVKGRVYLKDIQWDNYRLRDMPLANPSGQASFIVRDTPTGCRASWHYDDIDNMSDELLLEASELLDEWFTAVMDELLSEAVSESNAMMSDEALIEHADEVGIQWLPDGRPLY